MSNSDKIAYLNLIQGVITRLSNHNTTVRNWTVVALSALLAIEASHLIKLWEELIINLLLTLFFLWMSLFYHWKENEYIKLYEFIISEKEKEYNFILRPKEVLERNTPNIKYKLPSFFESLKSSKFNISFCVVMLLMATVPPFIFSKTNTQAYLPKNIQMHCIKSKILINNDS